MKNYLLSLFLFTLLTQLGFSQTSLKLEINHKLGQDEFSINKMAQNNLGQDFTVINLRYYLSNFSITHDSGKVYLIPDLVALVDASQPEVIDLGVHYVNKIEAISFYMGIDSARNHLDPSAYSPSDPLAPQSPSMHWGWASGYFFLSMTGKCGLNLRSEIDLQCLGDENYFQTTVENPLLRDSLNETWISIDGDYQGLLRSMDISESVIMHGPFAWAQQALISASKYVFFAPGSVFTALEGPEPQPSLTCYPNPVQQGQKLVIAVDRQPGQISWKMYDLMGREVSRQENLPAGVKNAIDCDRQGVFILKVFQEGELLGVRRILVE